MYDTDENLVILDDLDLFAFSDITVHGRRTNALIEALSHGLEKMIEYCFEDGYINVRSILRKANKFEIQKELSQVHVFYFAYHEDNFDLFKKVYYYLIDLL